MLNRKKILELEERICDLNKKIMDVCKHDNGFKYIKSTVDIGFFSQHLYIKACRVCGRAEKITVTEYNNGKKENEYNEAKKVVEEYEKKEVDDAK